MKHLIAFTDGGYVSAIYSDKLHASLKRVGPILAIARASYVEPCGDGWAVEMRFMARVYLGANGAVASLQEVEPFPTREAALVAEREWIERRLVEGNRHAGSA